MTTLSILNDIRNLAITIGIVYFMWSIVIKYDLHYLVISWLRKIPVYKNSELEVCVLCITFWGCYFTSVIIGPEHGVELWTYSVLKAVVALPIVIHLIKHQFEHDS